MRYSIKFRARFAYNIGTLSLFISYNLLELNFDLCADIYETIVYVCCRSLLYMFVVGLFFIF